MEQRQHSSWAQLYGSLYCCSSLCLAASARPRDPPEQDVLNWADETEPQVGSKWCLGLEWEGKARARILRWWQHGVGGWGTGQTCDLLPTCPCLWNWCQSQGHAWNGSWLCPGPGPVLSLSHDLALDLPACPTPKCCSPPACISTPSAWLSVPCSWRSQVDLHGDPTLSSAPGGRCGVDGLVLDKIEWVPAALGHINSPPSLAHYTSLKLLKWSSNPNNFPPYLWWHVYPIFLCNKPWFSWTLFVCGEVCSL